MFTLILLDVFLLVLFGTALSKHYKCVPYITGTDIGGRYHCQRRLRLHLRRIYADIAVWRWTSEGARFHFCRGPTAQAFSRNHALNGVFGEMSEAGFPDEVIDGN